MTNAAGYHASVLELGKTAMKIADIFYGYVDGMENDTRKCDIDADSHYTRFGVGSPDFELITAEVEKAFGFSGCADLRTAQSIRGLSDYVSKRVPVEDG